MSGDRRQSLARRRAVRGDRVPIARLLRRGGSIAAVVRAFELFLMLSLLLLLLLLL